MKQVNQVGKYTKKEDRLNAIKGKEFTTPQNKTYIFDFNKIGNKYTFLITYKGHTMQLKESDFNTTDTDKLLSIMERDIKIT